MTDVPNYGRVQYQDVYRGVDLVYYGSPGQLEYDLVVSAGAQPEDVMFAYDGASAVEIDDRG